MQIRMAGAVAGASGNVAGKFRPARVIDQRRGTGVPEHIYLGAKSTGETGGNIADPRLDPLLHLAAVGTQGTFQLHAFRQHVPGIASLDPRHAEHHRVEGVHLPAGHALQHRHQLAGQQDRIPSFMWAGGMRPLPGHFEDEAVDVGVERAAAGGKFAHRQAGLIVHTKGRRHVLQRPGADQGFRAAKIFLRRLKQEQDKYYGLCAGLYDDLRQNVVTKEEFERLHKEFQSKDEAQKEWNLRSPEAYSLHDELIHHGLFAYRNMPDVLTKVQRIADGSGHADI